MVPRGFMYSPGIGPYHQCCWCNASCVASCPLCGRSGGPNVGATERVLLEMKGRCVLQDLIPNVVQLEFATIPVKGWIIDPDVHDLLDGISNVVWLPAHYRETVHSDAMPRGVTTVRDGERGHKLFLYSSPMVLADSPMYSSLQSNWSHLYL